MTFVLVTAQSYNMYFITNRFLTKFTKIMNLSVSLYLKMFINVTNKFLGYQYVSGYFRNMFLYTLLKIIWKIQVVKVGHFRLQGAALKSKIQGGPCLILNQHNKIAMYANLHVFIIDLNN